MRSMSVRTLIASLVLIGVLLPSRATGQEGPEVEVRRLSNLWLCPMPVVGLSPGTVQRHIDELRFGSGTRFRWSSGCHPTRFRSTCSHPLWTRRMAYASCVRVRRRFS